MKFPSKYNKKNVFIIVERKIIKRVKNDVEDVVKSVIMCVSVMSM